MVSIKDKIKQSFSKSADTYDLASDIQNQISDKMLELLKDFHFKNILELGVGTGNYALKLIRQYANAKFSLLDFSEKMIEQTKTKLHHLNKEIKYYIKDVEEISYKEWDEKFDLITSNATFQWIDHLEESIKHVYKLLEPQGIFLFSTFGRQTYKELNNVIKIYFNKDDDFLPASQFKTKNNIKNSIFSVFKKHVIKEDKIIQEYDNIFSLLKKIKYGGEYGYGMSEKLFFTKRLLSDLEKIYLKKYKKIIASYHYYIILTQKV